MSTPVIDAHQHFWKYTPSKFPWISDGMAKLRNDFLPVAFEHLIKQHGISGSVLIQSEANEMINDVQLDLADQYPFIQGVVGWLDFNAPGLEEKLNYLSQFSRMKGFRHDLQHEKRRDSMLDEAFRKGIGLLGSFDFSYDLLILPDQLGYAEKLVSLFPGQRFVIDHLAKPAIRENGFLPWKSAIKRFSRYENVYCKVSGFVTEADWTNRDPEVFIPYFETIVEIFGTRRLMFGSDWPVCLLASEYGDVKQMVLSYFQTFTQTEQADIFGATAVRFYNLT